MPLRGFEEAPKTFWKFYKRFKDYEISGKPDHEEKSTIQSILNQIQST